MCLGCTGAAASLVCGQHLKLPAAPVCTQNDDLWEKYFNERRAVEKRTGVMLGNEQWLMHGSGATSPAQIYTTNGFDWHYSRTNCYFGQASYFAEQTSYSGAYALER